MSRLPFEPGEQPMLAKPIGSGVLFNGNLKGKVSTGAMDTCIAALKELAAEGRQAP